MASFASRPVGMEGGLFNAVVRQRVACCQRTLRVQCAPGAADRDQLCSWGFWCSSGVIADGKTEWNGAEVADGLDVCVAAFGC